jgi:preprotein translocase subunit SecE
LECDARLVAEQKNEDVLVTSDTDGTADGAIDPEFDSPADPTVGGVDDIREPVAAGVPAGSARAAARASAARAGVTAGKGRPTRSRDHGPDRGNLAKRIVRYLREVVAELRKVIWPTRNEMVTYSIVVVLFLIFMIAVTWGADFGFARLILAVFG